MVRDEIITEARSWIGTKWQHQAALKGVACDCVGLIRGIYSALVGPVTITFNYSREWPLYKAEEKMYEEVKKYLNEIPLAEAKPGDILLFGFGKGPAYHIGIVSYDGFIIHTWLDVGKVVESRYDEHWRENTRFAFRFPGVTD